MAFAIFDGLFGSDDPVSPLSNPDAGTGTAVLERPEEETKLDDGGNGDATVSRIMCRVTVSPNRR